MPQISAHEISSAVLWEEAAEVPVLSTSYDILSENVSPISHHRQIHEVLAVERERDRYRFAKTSRFCANGFGSYVGAGRSVGG